MEKLPAEQEEQGENKGGGGHRFQEHAALFIQGLKFTGMPVSIWFLISLNFALTFLPSSLVEPTHTSTTKATKMMYSTSPCPLSFPVHLMDSPLLVSDEVHGQVLCRVKGAFFPGPRGKKVKNLNPW
jgi:hypothetical protein